MNTQPAYNVATLIEEQKIGRFALGLLIWCFLIMLMDGYDQTAMSFAAGHVIRQWRIPRGDFGPIFGAGLFGTLLGSLLFGYLGDRIGRKNAIVYGGIGFGMLTLASAWATNVEQLMVLRFIAGIGMGGVFPNAVALVSEYAPKRVRATWVTAMFCGFSVGAASGGVVSSLLIHRYGWPVMFVVGGGGTLLVSTLSMAWLPESAKLLVVKRRDPATVRRLIKRLRPELVIAGNARFETGEIEQKERFVFRQIVANRLLGISFLLWLVFFVNSMTLYFLQSWLPVLIEATHVEPRAVGVITSMFSVGGVIGGLLLSRIVDRRGVLVIILFPLIGCPVAAALGLGITQMWLTLAVFGVGFCVVGAQYGLYGIAGMMYPTAFRSGAIGAAVSIGKIGSVAGPMIGGMLLSMHLPIAYMFYAASILFAVGVVFSFMLALLLRAVTHGRQPPATRIDSAGTQPVLFDS